MLIDVNTHILVPMVIEIIEDPRRIKINCIKLCVSYS
jgi:hypothetical protein